MFTYRPRRGPHPRAATRHAAARLRRLAAALAAVTCTLLASAAIMPAAWAAVNYIPNDSPAQAQAGGVVTAGGMPGWQITLIALGAALVAAAAAVLLDRAGRPPGSLGNHHVRRLSGGDNSSRAWSWSRSRRRRPVHAAPVTRGTRGRTR